MLEGTGVRDRRTSAISVNLSELLPDCFLLWLPGELGGAEELSGVRLRLPLAEENSRTVGVLDFLAGFSGVPEIGEASVIFSPLSFLELSGVCLRLLLVEESSWTTVGVLDFLAGFSGVPEIGEASVMLSRLSLDRRSA